LASLQDPSNKSLLAKYLTGIAGFVYGIPGVEPSYVPTFAHCADFEEFAGLFMNRWLRYATTMRESNPNHSVRVDYAVRLTALQTLQHLVPDARFGVSSPQRSNGTTLWTTSIDAYVRMIDALTGILSTALHRRHLEISNANLSRQ
jgi:hypothetical protein